jgi:hypothetical protein
MVAQQAEADIAVVGCISLDEISSPPEDAGLIENVPQDAYGICVWRRHHLAKESRWIERDIYRREFRM